MKIYLDLCCYKRPFDDHSRSRVRREAAAVARIIERAEKGELRLIRSPALLFENSANPEEDRRRAAAAWLDGAALDIRLTDTVIERARALASLGFGELDSFHLAFAEAAGARYFATCDDGLLRLGRRHERTLHVSIANPSEIGMEVEP
ncbi:MAG: hypothetical protein HY720_02915 [Planctomycetes bacterium]|nr:hypothetical protein [Planctomycetota bacterium]